MRIKNLLKKTAVTICAAAMAMTMCVGSAGVVLAEGESSSTTNYTIDTNKAATLTIHKYQKTEDNGKTEGTGREDTSIQGTPIKDAVFSYKKVAVIPTATISSSGSATLVYEIDTTLAAILEQKESSTKTEWTSDDLNTGLATAVTNPTYKSKLEAYMSGASTTTTDATGKAKANIGANELGLYLVVETAFPNFISSTTAPFFVSIPMTDSKSAASGTWNYDIHVYPKNQVDLPEINKLVRDDDDTDFTDTTTVSEGDIIDYIIITKVPVTEGSDAVKLDKFVFTDTLAPGMSYVGTDNNVTVDIHFTDKNTAAAAKTALTDNKAWAAGNYTATQDKENNKMTITATDSTTGGITDLNTADRSGKYMVVHYQATVNSAATVVLGENGNANTVTLTYSRKGDDTDANDVKISDKAKVFTYGLKLTKKFSDNSGTMSDVKFTLKNTSNGTSGEDIYVTGSDGVYYVCASTATGATNEVSPKTDGTLVINGLEADTYELTEIQTAKGYSLLKDKITIEIGATTQTLTADTASLENGAIKITKTNDAAASTAASTVSGTTVTLLSSGTGDTASTKAIVPLEVINTKSFTLPATGGLGAIVCTVLGAFAIGGAIVVLSRSKRKEDQ